MIKIILIFILLMCSVWGCGLADRPTQNNEMNAEVTTEESKTEEHAEDTSAEETTESAEMVTEEETETEAFIGEIAFDYRYIALTAFLGDEQKLPKPRMINSLTELKEYQNEYRDIFDFDYENLREEKFYQSFNSAVELYDEEWFAEHRLIIRTVTAPAYGYDYKVASVFLEKDVLSIQYERHSPMDLGAAISSEFMFIELDVTYLPETVTMNWSRTDIPFPWEDYLSKSTETP